jgi:hypothetical protein
MSRSLTRSHGGPNPVNSACTEEFGSICKHPAGRACTSSLFQANGGTYWGADKYTTDIWALVGDSIPYLSCVAELYFRVVTDSRGRV